MTSERAFAHVRRERRMSAEGAAALLRISAGHLRRLERGKLPLPLPLAVRMAAIYDSDLNELTRPRDDERKTARRTRAASTTSARST